MPIFDWDAQSFQAESLSAAELQEFSGEIIDGLAELPDTLDEADVATVDLQQEVLDAQAAANEAIAQGDYEAAAYHRELAEDAASASNAESLLDGPSALELQVADEHQDRALELESQQAELVQTGDFAAARELSSEAAWEMSEADQAAGGSDHSGQAEQEAANLDWADWHQQISDDMLSSAAQYASDGNLAAAENSAYDAASHADVAHDYGDRGEHGGALADIAPMDPIESHHVDSYAVADTASSLDTSSTASASASDSAGDLSSVGDTAD